MTEPKKIRYPKVTCSRCGDCCRVPIVPVTHKDVARLVKHTGKPADKLVRFGSSDEMSYDDESGLWIKLKSGKYAMVLRKKKSGKCIFQTAGNACSAYAARPQTCRTFPYCVEFEGSGSKVVCKISLNKIMTCNAKRCSSIDMETLINNAVKENREDRAYHRHVKRWNQLWRSGKSSSPPNADERCRITDFLRFIGF